MGSKCSVETSQKAPQDDKSETAANSMQPQVTVTTTTVPSKILPLSPFSDSVEVNKVYSNAIAPSIPNTSVPSISLSPTPSYDNWEVNKAYQLPSNAVHAGYDIDGKIMYVSRVFYDGDYIPAKAFNVDNMATFPYNGQEIFEMNFEYLIGDNYIWVPGQPFPPGAVVVNPLSTKEHLYVGRCNHGGSLLCGKFVRSINCLYVPFGLKEIAITGPFEILVHKDRYETDWSLQTITGEKLD